MTAVYSLSPVMPGSCKVNPVLRQKMHFQNKRITGSSREPWNPIIFGDDTHTFNEFQFAGPATESLYNYIGDFSSVAWQNACSVSRARILAKRLYCAGQRLLLRKP